MKNFLQILKFAKPFKGLLAQIAIAIVVVAVYKQITPLVTGHVIDVLQRFVDGELSSDGVWNAISLSLGILFVFTVLNWIAGRISWRQATILQEKLKGHMRLHALEHLLSLEVSFFDQQASGHVMSKMNRGIDRITNQINESTSFFIPNLLAAVLAIIIIAQIQYQFVLLMLLAFVPFVLINLWAIAKHEPYQKRFNKLYDIEFGHFWEVISSIRLVKSFNQAELEKKKMERFNRKIVRINSKIEQIWDKASVRDLFLALWVFGLNIYLISQVTGNGMTIGTYVLLTQYTITLREPLWNMTWMYFEYKKALIASRELMQIFNRSPKIKDAQKAIELDHVDGRIVFSNVDFGYKPNVSVFEDLSFTIEDGQTVALVGKSGAGKTTIASLLNRFYEVDGGKITIDNHDIRNITQSSLRDSIGVVLQESYLFDDSIEENLKYGKKNATEEEMINACKMANAWEFVSDLDKGLKTQIGERGIKLSGGQKQRLSIARTILKSPPILVFDEATSSLDSESESRVQQAVFRLVENRSTIIIAHRLSTVRRADKIIVLGDQNIIEQGTHDELMKLGGIYAKLYTMQSHKEQNDLLKEYEMV